MTTSERTRRVLQQRDLVLDRNPAQHVFAVREPSESIDNGLVCQGKAGLVAVAEPADQRHGKRLVCRILPVLEGKVEKQPFLVRHGAVVVAPPARAHAAGTAYRCGFVTPASSPLRPMIRHLDSGGEGRPDFR